MVKKEVDHMIPDTIKDKLLAIPRVVSAGLSLAGIEIHARKGTPVPTEIDGVKLIIIETGDTPELVVYTRTYDPIRPGTIINTGSIGVFREMAGGAICHHRLPFVGAGEMATGNPGGTHGANSGRRDTQMKAKDFIPPGRGIICRQNLRRWGDEQFLHGPPGG